MRLSIRVCKLRIDVADLKWMDGRVLRVGSFIPRTDMAREERMSGIQMKRSWQENVMVLSSFCLQGKSRCRVSVILEIENMVVVQDRMPF